MWVSSFQLVTDGVDDVVDRKLLRLHPDVGLKDDLEQKIAQLFAMFLGILAVHDL